MTNHVLEIARITLLDGVTEADLLAASTTFQADFVAHQPGFISRKLVRTGDGGFADVIEWETPEAAQAVMAAAKGSPAAGAFFALMDFSEGIAGGVDHFTILQSN